MMKGSGMNRADDDSVHIVRVCLALCVLATFRVASLLSSEACFQLCAESSVNDWRHVPNEWWHVVGAAGALILSSAYFLEARRVLQRATFAAVVLRNAVIVCFAFWSIPPAAYHWVNICFSVATAAFAAAAVASQLGELRQLDED